MPGELKLTASGVRVLRGVSGRVYTHAGVISIVKAAVKGVDSNLLRVLETAVDELKISIVIASIDTGDHVPNSRHGHGCAVDIDEIGPMGEPLQPVHLANKSAAELVVWLVEQGFTAGHENGDYPAVLLGPVGTKWNQTAVGHSGHAHISLHPLAGE